MMLGKLNQQKICIGNYALLSAERSSHVNDKMAPISQKNYPTVKFQITDPPKVLVSAFSYVNINEIWHWPLCIK